jgi:calcineurin-like phosphoesterase
MEGGSLHIGQVRLGHSRKLPPLKSPYSIMVIIIHGKGLKGKFGLKKNKFQNDFDFGSN